MRNYDFWKNQKTKDENQARLILILSWIFYKTFDNDARFLSDKFWFKIKVEWWYESIWFPKSVLEKYSVKLKEEEYWYIVFEKQDWDYIEISINNWKQKLSFNNTHLVFLENKKEENSFKEIIYDLKHLIEKYS